MHTAEELSTLAGEYISRLPMLREPYGLYEPISYALASGGKRMRPLLTLMACDAVGGNVVEALPVAAAVEIFHNFTLLHDDIMDNAVVRRGRPTVCRRFGRNAAVLSGDAMLILAYRMLREGPADRADELAGIFDDMALKVCEGQQYDMDFEASAHVSMQEYMTMIGGKTAALLAAAVEMGAVAGGASDREREAMRTFGWQLGLAFQIQDDLLDTYGTSDRLGKNVGGDIAEGKKTFLSVYACEAGDPDTQLLLGSLLSDRQTPAPERFRSVKEIYDRLGAPKAAGKEVLQCLGRASAALDVLDAGQTGPLNRLAGSLLGRDR